MKTQTISRTGMLLPGLLIIPLLVICVFPDEPVHAAQWHRLTRTARYQVALEMESLQQSDDPSLTVLLQFTPQGEAERLAAAERYGHKQYALHLEQHQIDCTKRTYRLEYVDILGWRGNRLARIPGGSRKESIAPDSVLDRVAALVCPEEEADQGEESDGLTEGMAATSSPNDPLLSREMLQRINDAQGRTNSQPDDVDAWVELGNAWYDADMPEQAIQAYDRALALKADDTDVLNDQGAMFRQKGDTARALANFEKALAIDPGNLESLYNLGYVYAFDLNRMDRAREIWQRYLNLDSTSETADQIRSFITQQGQGVEKP